MKKIALLSLSLLTLPCTAHGMMKYVKTGKNLLKETFKKHPKKYTMLGIASAAALGGVVGFTLKSYKDNNVENSKKDDTQFNFDRQEHGLKIAKSTNELYLTILQVSPEKKNLEDAQRRPLFKTITSYSIADIPVELLTQVATDKKLQRELIQFYYIHGAPASSSSISETQKKLWHTIFSQYTLEDFYEMLYYEAETENIAKTIDPLLASDLIKINKLWQQLCTQKKQMDIPIDNNSIYYHEIAKKYDITMPSWIKVAVNTSEKYIPVDGIQIMVDKDTAQQPEDIAISLGQNLGHIMLGHDISLLHSALYYNVDPQDPSSIETFYKRRRDLSHHEVITADIFLCLMSTKACNASINKLRYLRKDASLEAKFPGATKVIPGNMYIIRGNEHDDEENLSLGENDRNPSHVQRIRIMETVLEEKEMAEKGYTFYPLFQQLGINKWSQEPEKKY